jgi:hypothetical protein
VVADVATSCARVGADEFELTVTSSGGRVEIRNAEPGSKNEDGRGRACAKVEPVC